MKYHLFYGKLLPKWQLDELLHGTFCREKLEEKIGKTLSYFQASDATNFIFKLTRPLSEEQAAEVNGIDSNSKIRDRILKVEEFGSNLEFYKMQSENFERNFVMIDSKFPEILARVLQNFYKGEALTISDAVEKLNQTNPLGYDMSDKHPFYAYKIKNFLTDCALGMTPATCWKGTYDANGGYIIVKEDGEILCYHIYNRNEFQEYLFANTKFETPSSTRHGFGTVYKEDGEDYFKLNLQIRFK
jgi:type II restriction enzyme